MTRGIAVELTVEQPGDCPVAAASASAGAPVTSVSRAVASGSEGVVAEEFELPTDAAPEASAVETVARFDDRDVYRFERETAAPCVCDVVERHAGPVSDVRARDGTLVLSFYAAELSAVRAAVEALEEGFGGVQVRQLTRAGDDGSDPVIVDRNRLTERQREVLRTAHEMGYFDYPKGANAGEVADALGIASSTLREHLGAAQSKLLSVVLEDGAAE